MISGKLSLCLSHSNIVLVYAPKRVLIVIVDSLTSPFEPGSFLGAVMYTK